MIFMFATRSKLLCLTVKRRPVVPVWSAALLLLAAALPIAIQPPVAAAQQPGPDANTDQPQPPKDPGDLLNEAYRKTKGAKTRQQFSDIIDLCKRALEAKPDKEKSAYIQRLLSWSSNRRGETYIDEAMAAEDKGDFPQADKMEALALADFELAVRCDPKRWKAIHNRAVSYAHLEKFKEAIADLTVVVALKPDHANAWFNRAELRVELGMYEPAIEDYTEALKLDAKDQSAYLGRGRAYALLKRFDNSLADYNRVLAIDQKNVLAYSRRAALYLSMGRWQLSSNDYRQAIQINNRFGPAYRGAAWLMATCPDERFRHADLALQAANKAIELDGPDDQRNLEALAAAQASAGQFRQAAQTQKKAIGLVPQAQRGPLEARLQLYLSNKPYRQSEPEKKNPPG